MTAGRGHHLPDDYLSRLARRIVADRSTGLLTSILAVLFCALLALVLAGRDDEAGSEPAALPAPAVSAPQQPACEPDKSGRRCRVVLALAAEVRP